MKRLSMSTPDRDPIDNTDKRLFLCRLRRRGLWQGFETGPSWMVGRHLVDVFNGGVVAPAPRKRDRRQPPPAEACTDA